MEIASDKNAVVVGSEKSRIRTLPGKIKENVVNVAKNVKKVGQDDPRRIDHSVKVGIALTIVSLLYYFRPLYNGFGQSGMWAILTVVVVFEFTVGGTVYKCMNRGFATFMAGVLGMGAEHLASLCGKKGDPIVLGLLVFLLAAGSTFMRFVPLVKRRYDYGVMIFILTFSLVTVSGYRVEQIFELAYQRISTILIGVATCMLVSIFIRPVWAGQDLHSLILRNVEKLATFLEVYGGENGPLAAAGSHDGKANLQDYKSVLTAKATEETLANFAWWEPGHGSFGISHPWKHYLKIGALTRECACQIETLTLTGTAHKFSDPKSEIQRIITKSCTVMSLESGKALRELASSMKETRHPSPAVETHLQNSKSAMDDLTRLLNTLSFNQIGGGKKLGEIVQALAIASVLVEIIKCVERVSESVKDLAKQANFKPTVAVREKTGHLLRRGLVKPADDGDHIIISMDGIGPCKEEVSAVENREICPITKPVLP